ncbi:MAG: pitrilysin family protein [Armatimonadota bacterium]|nr:insulinase family protein [bacterium]MDW8320769.1 pitrilysin family protein [Armatimonadota bacterium]
MSGLDTPVGMHIARKVFLGVTGLIICVALSGVAVAEPVKRVLSNGMVIVVSHEPSARVVALEAFLKVGVWAEPEDKRGIGLLVSRSLFGSTTNETMQTLAQEIERVGGEIRSYWQPDYTQISITTTAEAFDDAAWLLAEGIKNAQFEPEVVSRAKQETLAEAQAERAVKFRSTFMTLRTLLYPPNHPYAYPFTGDPAYIRRATPQDLQEFHRRFYTPDNLVIVVVGNVPAERVVEKFTTLFGSWETRSAMRRPHLTFNVLREPFSKVREQAGNTAYIMVGYPVPGITSAEYPALTVLDAILGRGKSSRIFTNLRDASGIGYEIGSFYPPLAGGSCLLGFVEIAPYRISAAGIPVLIVDEVQKALVQQVQSVKTDPPSEQEVERAKKLVIGSYALRHQRVRDRAYFLGWYECVGLGYQFDRQFADKIAAVKRDDILRLAQKYLQHAAVVVTMPSD